MPSYRGRDKEFDISYGIASVALNTTGLTVVATTAAFYHGLSILASAAVVIVKVYNSAGGTSNLVDVIYASATGTGWTDKYIPIVCRTGLCVSVTGTGGDGVIYYSPRG